MAVEAGNDIILSSTTALLNESLWTKNLDLMSTDPEFRKKVKDAVYRVIKVKLDYYKSGNPIAPLYPDANQIDNFVPNKDGEKFFIEQACRSVTATKKGTFPLTQSNGGRILLAGSLPGFFETGKAHYPEAGEFRFNYDIGPNETQWVIDNLPKTAAGYDTIVLCVSNENHKRIAEIFKNTNKKVIILSTMSPIIVENMNWVDSILLGYSWRCEYSLKAMVSALAGDYEPKGVLPYTE